MAGRNGMRRIGREKELLAVPVGRGWSKGGKKEVDLVRDAVDRGPDEEEEMKEMMIRYGF